MIRPSRTFILYVAIVCTLLTCVYIFISGLFAFLLFIFLILLVPCFDLMISYSQVTTIDLEVKDKVRGHSDVGFKLPLLLTSRNNSAISVKVIIQNLAWAKNLETVFVNLPAMKVSELKMEGVFTNRGKYSFGAVGLVFKSSLALWEMKQNIPVEQTVNIYPSFLEQRKILNAQLFNKNLHGLHIKRQMGKGKDFERLREYEPGDSYDNISWKATAKKGAPVSKVYQIEKTQEIYLAIDCSRLSLKETVDANGNVSKVLDKYLEVAYLLGEQCISNGDKFGLILFSDRIIRFVKAKSGKQHLNLCKEILFNITAVDLSPDFGEVFSEIYERIPKRSFILFLSNLEDVAEAEIFADKVRFISKKHLTYVQMIQTSDISPVFSKEVFSHTDLASSLSGHLRWANIIWIKKELKLKGVELELVKNSVFVLNAINMYMLVKQKQAI